MTSQGKVRSLVVLGAALSAVLCLAALAQFFVTAPGATSDAKFAALCETGAAGTVRQALRDGANANARGHVGFTALMYAARGGNAEAVKALLSAGADVNAGNDQGRTALMLASGAPETVRLLLAAGADVNAKSHDGRTALMSAAVAGDDNPEAIDLLLSAGADIHAQTPDGRTALMLAAGRGNPEIVAALLSAGAPKRVHDKAGHDALWHAMHQVYEYVPFRKTLFVMWLLDGLERNPEIEQAVREAWEVRKRP